MASAYDVANFFLELDYKTDGDGISNLKLQKLVYYAQGFYSALFDKPLFPEDIQAWSHGPVTEALYHKYKEHGKNPIPYTGVSSHKNLEPDEIELIEEVYEVFGQYSAWKLRNMTHEESPWLNHESAAEIIPISEITDYFKSRLN